MPKNIFFLLFVFVGFSAFSQESGMTSSEINSFKQKVTAESQNTKTIKTDFVQYKHMDFLSEDVKTSGKMVFQTPNFVRWEYTNPYQYSVIFKEDELLINDGGKKSSVNMGSSKLFKKLNELIVNSVKGDMFHNADFNVEFFKSPAYYKAVFTSKDKKIKEFIASFELFFSKENAEVMEVKMIEPSQDYTRIEFKNRVLNQPVDASVFRN